MNFEYLSDAVVFIAVVLLGKFKGITFSGLAKSSGFLTYSLLFVVSLLSSISIASYPLINYYFHSKLKQNKFLIDLEYLTSIKYLIENIALCSIFDCNVG